MKLKNDFVIKDVLGMSLAVALANNHSDFNGVINFNEEGKRIFELIQEGKDEDDITATLLEEYDATEEQVRAEIAKVVKTLEEEGLLE